MLAGTEMVAEMALVIGTDVYSGADCINRLALMSTRSGLFNRINAIIFSSRRFSRWAYPYLRGARNLALRILGRTPIPQARGVIWGRHHISNPCRE